MMLDWQSHHLPNSPGVPRFMGHVSDGDQMSALEGKNAADWMLEVTSITAANKLGVDFAHVYRESKLARCAAR